MRREVAVEWRTRERERERREHENCQKKKTNWKNIQKEQILAEKRGEWGEEEINDKLEMEELKKMNDGKNNGRRKREPLNLNASESQKLHSQMLIIINYYRLLWICGGIN